MPTATKRPTVKQLAAEVGISARQLQENFAAGCPRDSVEVIRAWRKKNVRPASNGNPRSYSEARLALLKNQTLREAELAEKYAIENAVRRGELVERADIERDLAVAMSRLVNRLNSLGTRCANLCPAELKVPVKNSIEETVRLALKEIAEDLRR